MIEQQTMRQVFKEFRVLSAPTAEQIGLNISAMMLLDKGWNLYGPVMAVSKGDGVEYFQGIIKNSYEVVPADPPTLTEAESTES